MQHVEMHEQIAARLQGHRVLAVVVTGRLITEVMTVGWSTRLQEGPELTRYMPHFATCKQVQHERAARQAELAAQRPTPAPPDPEQLARVLPFDRRRS
jgi:hypothetical protein